MMKREGDVLSQAGVNAQQFLTRASCSGSALKHKRSCWDLLRFHWSDFSFRKADCDISAQSTCLLMQLLLQHDCSVFLPKLELDSLKSGLEKPREFLVSIQKLLFSSSDLDNLAWGNCRCGRVKLGKTLGSPLVYINLCSCESVISEMDRSESLFGLCRVNLWWLRGLINANILIQTAPLYLISFLCTCACVDTRDWPTTFTNDLWPHLLRFHGHHRKWWWKDLRQFTLNLLGAGSWKTLKTGCVSQLWTVCPSLQLDWSHTRSLTRAHTSIHLSTPLNPKKPRLVPPSHLSLSSQNLRSTRLLWRGWMEMFFLWFLQHLISDLWVHTLAFG